MDYLKIYNSICNRGKQNRSLTYSEKHHIIPKCVGGTDDAENMTSLTHKEHYVAHRLLTKIHKNNYKIYHAFSAMARSSKKVKRKYNSKQYEHMKKIRALAMKENNPMKCENSVKKMAKTRSDKMLSGEIINPMTLDSARMKISRRMSSNENPMIKYPEKNKSSKKITVYYKNGMIKKFPTIKSFCLTMEKFSITQMRYRIENKKYDELEIIDIVYDEK